jgi:hypothetical protein
LHELHPHHRPPTRTNLCEGERHRAPAPPRVPSADSFFLQNAVEWLKSKKGKMAILQPRPTCQSSETELISRTPARMV